MKRVLIIVGSCVGFILLAKYILNPIADFIAKKIVSFHTGMSEKDLERLERESDILNLKKRKRK